MEYIKLSEICDLQNGYAFKSSDYVNYSNTINCRMSNIRPGAIFDLNYSPKYLPDDFAEKYSDYLLNDEDIVIAMTDLAGDPKILGVPAQVKTNGKNVLLNQRVGRLILKNKDIDFRYLKYNLSNPKNKEYYKRFSGGGLQINISKKDILNLEIPLHEKKEQLQIADKLDNIQKIINIRKEEIEKCNKLIKSQFVEMFGNIKTNDRNWEIYSNLLDYCVFNPKKNEITEIDNDTMVTFLPMQNVSIDGVINYSIEKKISEVWKGFTYFKENDILFAKITPCMENGKGAVAKKLKNGIGFGTTEFHVIRPNKEINSTWLYYVFADKEFRKEASENMTGSAGQKRVPITFLENYKLAIPPIELQNKFAQIVEQIDKQKFEFEKSLKKLEELQASLMQEYFG